MYRFCKMNVPFTIIQCRLYPSSKRNTISLSARAVFQRENESWKQQKVWHKHLKAIKLKIYLVTVCPLHLLKIFTRFRKLFYFLCSCLLPPRFFHFVFQSILCMILLHVKKALQQLKEKFCESIRKQLYKSELQQFYRFIVVIHLWACIIISIH